MPNTSTDATGDPTVTPPSFTFHAGDGGAQVDIPLRYSADPHFPGRVNAITGPAGAGKSRILADLSRAARQPPPARHSRIDPQDTTFGNILTISYTAMDHFDREDDPPAYRHSGLVTQSPAGPPRLKDPNQLLTELAATMASASPDQLETLHRHITPLREETSMRLIGATLTYSPDQKDHDDHLRNLAPAHLVAANIAADLSLHLETNGLVLMDQPEAHLHPSLLAALMSILNQVLRERDARAVVATHSPVVLQEIPASQVHVLTRYGNTTTVHAPSIQTFGETTGLIATHVLNLDATRSQYAQTLRDLSASRSLEDIEQLFSQGLSSQARALLMNLRRRAPR